MGSAGHSVVLINALHVSILTEHKQGGKFVSHFIADFNVIYKELEQNTPILTYICIVNMDICHICVIFCAVQLLSSNVALIICYRYHIKIEKRSEIKAHLDNTVIVMP